MSWLPGRLQFFLVCGCATSREKENTPGYKFSEEANQGTEQDFDGTNAMVEFLGGTFTFAMDKLVFTADKEMPNRSVTLPSFMLDVFKVSKQWVWSVCSTVWVFHRGRDIWKLICGGGRSPSCPRRGSGSARRWHPPPGCYRWMGQTSRGGSRLQPPVQDIRLWFMCLLNVAVAYCDCVGKRLT